MDYINKRGNRVKAQQWPIFGVIQEQCQGDGRGYWRLASNALDDAQRELDRRAKRYGWQEAPNDHD
jgi:hypothetical protein